MYLYIKFKLNCFLSFHETFRWLLFIKRQTTCTWNDNEWYNEWQWVLQRMKTSQNEWQWVATNGNEWQQMTSSNSEWQQVVQRMKTNKSKQNRDFKFQNETKGQSYVPVWFLNSFIHIFMQYIITIYSAI